MPGNPLTNPNWANELTDTIERVVGTVRKQATTRVVYVTRGLVYGLIAAFLGIFALVVLLIALTRGIQALLELLFDWPRAVYLSYLIIGGLMCVGGLVLMRSRRPDDA